MSAATRLADTRQAFDAVAEIYDGPFGNNEIVQRMRAVLLDRLTRRVPPPARLLDLGCGTGIDAAFLASRGYRVTAIDASARMVARTRSRAAREGLGERVTALELGIERLARLAGETFDAVYSDLGALNCVPDLAAVAADAAALLRPRGAFVASVIGRICPWEIAYFLARGDLARARVRFAAGAVPVTLEAGTVWTRYVSPREFRRAFSLHFAHRSTSGIGVLAPPPYLVGFHRRLPRLSRALALADRALSSLPLLRDAGDHFLMELEKRE